MRSRSKGKLKPQGHREAASQALTLILEPLARFAIESGLSVEDVYRLLRVAAIRSIAASQAELALKTNISGIAASTGIPRAEVSRLLKEPRGAAAEYSVNDQTTNVVLAAWREDPKFTTASGHPAALKLYGRGRTFDNLVKTHGRGIPTRAILEELVRTHSISVEPNQIVRQRAEVAIERGVSGAAIKIFGESVSELANTLILNMKSPSDGRLVSTVSSRTVPTEAIPLLRREIKERSQEYLTDVQDLLMQRSSSKRQRGQDTGTLGVTTFYFEAIDSQRARGNEKRKNYRRVMKS